MLTKQEILDRAIVETCAAFGIRELDLLSFDRRQAVNLPRKICYLVLREDAGLSCQDIGKVFGRTRQIIHRSIESAQWYAEHPEFSSIVDDLRHAIHQTDKPQETRQ